MAEPGARRGRAHDAQGAREAILNAAEQVFAEHGFDGARVDAIAAAAGYNKSLIFQYFHDKLGLYSEVIRRADREANALQAQTLMGWFKGKDAYTPENVRNALRAFLNSYFDYLLEHPRFTRILLWEMAEGWQTMSKIFTQRDIDEVEEFRSIADNMRKAGLLRYDFDPIGQFMMIEFLYPMYLAIIPLFALFMPGANFSSPEALARSKEYIVDFVLQGLLADPGQGEPAAQAAPGDIG